MVEIGKGHPHDPEPENLWLSISDNDETRRDTEEVAHSGNADCLLPGQQTVDEHPLPSGDWAAVLGCDRAVGAGVEINNLAGGVLGNLDKENSQNREGQPFPRETTAKRRR